MRRRRRRNKRNLLGRFPRTFLPFFSLLLLSQTRGFRVYLYRVFFVLFKGQQHSFTLLFQKEEEQEDIIIIVVVKRPISLLGRIPPPPARLVVVNGIENVVFSLLFFIFLQKMGHQGVVDEDGGGGVKITENEEGKRRTRKTRTQKTQRAFDGSTDREL